MTTEEFDTTPLRIGAYIQRLWPLSQIVVDDIKGSVHLNKVAKEY